MSSYLRCCRHWDCAEGEDEFNCPIIPATSLSACVRHPDDQRLCSCPVGTGHCDNNLCLGHDKWCNGVSECGDTSDEPATCSTCLGRLSLTDPGKLCDGVKNCPDLEDETPAACQCPEKSWRCDLLNSNTTLEKKGECIEMTSLCDGIEDCTNGEDEHPSICIAISPLNEIFQNVLLVQDRMTTGFLKVNLSFRIGNLRNFSLIVGKNLWQMVHILHSQLV